MSTPWGVQPTGFVRKPLSAIVQSFNDGVQQTVNAQADVSASSPLGKWHSILGSALDEAWGLVQTAYSTFNRDVSAGAALDGVGAISRSLRLAQKPSVVLCNCVFTASTTYPKGTLIANVAGQPTVQFSNAQDIVVPVASPPISPTNSRTLTGLVFTSIEDGPIAAPAGQLTQISASVSGWFSIANPTDAQLGNLVEDDPTYRVRQNEEIFAVGASQSEALSAVLLELPHVIAVRVIENTLSVPDPVTGMPPHSFQTLIYADASVDWTQVSQTIWNEKPAGMEAYGTTWPSTAPTPFVQLDSQGNDVSSRTQWTPVQTAQLNIQFRVLFSPGLTSAQKTATAAQLANTVANLAQGFDPNGNTLPIGTPGILVPAGSPGLLASGWTPYGFVYALPYIRAALKTPGIADVLLFTFVSPGPVPTVQPPNITTIALNQIATVTTATNGIVVFDQNLAIWHS